MSKTRMLNKTVTTTLILLLTLSILNVINFIAIPRASAVTLVDITRPTVGIAVNETGYWKASDLTFTRTTHPIEAAVTAASGGDNITVVAGTYTETVYVDKQLTLQGASSATVTVNSLSALAISVFTVTASVNISGFTVSGATQVYGIDAEPAGIYLSTDAVSCNISNNVLTDNFDGIKLDAGSNHNTLTNNTLWANTGQGFEIVGSDYNTFTNNNASSNTRYGFKLDAASHNTFTGNTANSNGKYGFYAVKGAGALPYQGYLNNTFTGNTANSNTEYGFRSDYGNATTLTGNTFNSNVVAGIRLKENITNLMLDNNSISGSQYGIDIEYSTLIPNATSWTLIHNNIAGNTVFGLYNISMGALNATLNWWGHTTGPSNYGNGYGDAVSANVLYDPWLSAPYPSTTVFAGIWLKPTRASAGSTIEVFSSNLDFTAAETVRTYFEASIVNTTTAATNGSLYATFTVPSVSAGAYTVTSVGSTSSNSYSATFTIPTLSITLTPTWGPPGKTVSVTGEGFTRLGLVRIYLDGTYMNSTSANAYGNITNTFTVPTTTVPGTYTVKANDASTTSNATQTLTVPTHTLTDITPTAGPPKTSVAVTGGNFTIGGAVGIYFDTTFAWNYTANADGAITTGSFDVPSLVPGTYAVKGKDWSTGTYTSSTSFTVSTPLITRTPTSGPPGTLVTVTGGNFTVSNVTKIYFDSTSVANATTNATGGIASGNTFNVPSVVPGTYTVRVMDNYTAYNVTTTFTVPTPTLTLTPDGGPPSTTVTISGINYTETGAVRIYFDAISMNNVTTNSTGGIPLDTTFTVPANTTIGAHTVRAFDVATTYNKTATFTAGPVIWIDTAAGTPLTNVTVTGSGFAINQTAKIYFDTTFIQNATANATGGLNTWFLIPDAVAGAHNISAYDVNTTIWTPAQTFTISQPATTLSPVYGQVGELVSVAPGSNFKPNATVNIYFGSTLVRTVNATSGGALPASTNFTVPSVLPAQYTVNASDGVNYATATFNVLGTGGIDTLQSMVAEIEAKLDQYGSFWNFTNTWFTTISNKLGVFTGTDTVASLLYDIRTSVIAINFTSIDNKLGTFSGTDTVASLLSSIKSSVSTINWTDITAIKAKTDTINWADITSIKSTTTLSIDYLWGLQDHPLWGLRTVVVPMLQSIKNATQFTAGTYSTIVPTSAAPVNLGKSSKVTLTVRATDDTTEGFVIKAYIYDGTAWRPLSFSVSGIVSADCAATVEFTTGADGRLYFEITGATFTAFTYSAEFAP